MATLDQIIQREANPFDPVTFTTGNFWNNDVGGAASTVQSIHQEAIEEIESVLDLVIKDNYTRSILLQGDRGCGKSYLLARLKTTFNSKAFFAYIGRCTHSDYIWRHTLRQLVDSLMHVPEGQSESQLLLWLKGLSAFRDRSFMKKMLGERGLFILNFRSTYPTGIYQANDFFNALYQLANPKLFFSACDWLRGENLDGEQLKLLGVRSVIDNEEAAKGIIGNFGKIAGDTKPIVLCFDQVESGPRLSDNSLSLSPYFEVNTTLHNEHLKNFLVLISIVQDIWHGYDNKRAMPQSDRDRLNKSITLKDISWEQVKALWTLRLYPLHCQAEPKPKSPIAPLDEGILAKHFPGGKVNLRNSLILGQKFFFQSKLGPGDEPQPENSLAAFQLLWRKEFNETQVKIDRIRKFSSLELVEMLKQALKALGIKIVKNEFLPSKNYRSYSFSCQVPGRKQIMGIVWYEEPNLGGFFYAMKACQKALEKNICDYLVLIRSENLGNNNNKGYQLFKTIFNDSSQQHITPDLDSVYYLRTYQAMAAEAMAEDLVLGSQTADLEEVEELIRESKILEQCSLLMDLELFIPSNERDIEKVDQIDKEPEIDLLPRTEVTNCLFNLVQTQQVISAKVLIDNCTQQFPEVNQAMIEEAIKQLAQAKLVLIMNPKAKLEEKLVSLVPQGSVKNRS